MPTTLPAPARAPRTLDEIADRMIDWAVNRPDVRALWIEAEERRDVRRPYRGLRLHLAADEPAWPGLVAALPLELERVLGARVTATAETRRFAREIRAEAGSLAFTLIAEQSYLLAKRPRAEVIPLVDKTGQITSVMDFSGRKRG